MPRYSLQVGNGETVCELDGIELPDSATARECAIAFVAALFNAHSELYAGEWDACTVRVVGLNKMLFSETVPQVAMMERDMLRVRRRSAGDNFFRMTHVEPVRVDH